MAQAQEVATSNNEEFQKILKLKDAEIVILKEKLTSMENEVAEAQKIKAQKKTQHDEVHALKIQSEGILTKAKAMIFENTKVIKNQELQIEALGQQNESLKDVVRITKDLLEIRNLEVKQLENKINAMEGKVKAEKERQDLLHKKLETMIRHNGELKREYETQLCLFNALRKRYSEKELAKDVVKELGNDVDNARRELHKVNEENNEQKQVDGAENQVNGGENLVNGKEEQVNVEEISKE
ncbi:unnamed protein product [Ceutorhynchus assimilis]|uniref:Uncharacterized protein n=1 Tax=Ceutorhynchus assimilis TaxID=467358 RepID=A0A9N9QPG8_9CUCU|nr:unnamed protein product [Ceutorhynchus assimilis]